MTASATQGALSSALAAGRELAVLVDGPWAPRWYWRSDLEAMQAASRRIGHREGHPAAQLRSYQPSEEFRPHPIERDAGVTGRVWRWTPTHQQTSTATPSRGGAQQ